MCTSTFFRIYDVNDPVVLNKGIRLSSKFWVCGCVLQACALVINLAICESEGGYYMLSVLPTAIKLHRVICSHCATQLQRTDNYGIAQHGHWVQRPLTTQRTPTWPFRYQQHIWRRVCNNGPEWWQPGAAEWFLCGKMLGPKDWCFQELTVFHWGFIWWLGRGWRQRKG